MTNSTTPFRLAACLGSSILLATLAPPAAADWLVTSTGEQLETKGSWEQRGRLIVFHSVDGSLASIRADRIDLDASRELTVARQESPQVSSGALVAEAVEGDEPPVSRIVLNDDNLRDFHGGASGTFSAGPSASGASSTELESSEESPQPVEAPSAAPPVVDEASAESLLVDTWRTVQSDAGSEIIGTLINTGNVVQANIRLRIHVYGVDGELIASQPAHLATPILSPGRDSAFRLLLPQTFGVQRAEFTLTSTPFEARAPQSTSSGEGENTVAERPVRSPSGSARAAPTKPTGAGP